MKIMLDTMIYDLIHATPGMEESLNRLISEGRLTILCTHIQEDQIAKISNKKNKNLVMETFENIIKTKVKTSGAIHGRSKYGQSTYGDGRDSGVRTKDIISPSGQHSDDALIATTAAQHADILVTEEKRFQSRMKRLSSSCKIWDFEQLKKLIFDKT